MDEIQTESTQVISGPTNIYEAICAVRRAVPYVKKKQPERGSAIKYSYAEIEGMLNALHSAMGDAGIVVMPVGKEILADEVYKSKSGGNMRRILLKGSFDFIHGPTSTKHVVVAIGEGTDSGDKATPKAETAAFKVALRQAFMIETGNHDPDNTISDEIDTTAGPEVLADLVSKMSLTTTHAELQSVWDIRCGSEFSQAQAHELQDHHDKASERLNGELLYTQAYAAIIKMDDHAKLTAAIDGIKSSTKYSDPKKVVLITAIETRLDELEATTPNV